ncbi:hypothetical protein EYF80_046897 [Liparis tanakae]|uniref:Uncharacterized protein n=1 Tax=Liparis tanakae TaxID=230148 RepID=A0A4Z2FQD4_9TELE|nr:hypothetical protein EYF80_046897 [Liparis tanakae]
MADGQQTQNDDRHTRRNRNITYQALGKKMREDKEREEEENEEGGRREGVRGERRGRTKRGDV